MANGKVKFDFKKQLLKDAIYPDGLNFANLFGA